MGGTAGSNSPATSSRALAPTLTIADLLSIVNDDYPELLPETVREHFNSSATPASNIRYSTENDDDSEEIMLGGRKLLSELCRLSGRHPLSHRRHHAGEAKALEAKAGGGGVGVHAPARMPALRLPTVDDAKSERMPTLTLPTVEGSARRVDSGLRLPTV